MRSLRFLTITVGALAILSARADVTLAPLFADHAVLQRDRPVPIWGTADVGEKVVVTFAGQSHAVTAAADGRWIVVLDALPTSAVGADLVVTGKNTLTLKNIVVGDVWLCSGQSNMEFTVDSRPGTWQATSRVTGADADIALARYPLIRHIRIGQSVAAAPSGTVATSGWQLTTPQTVGGFTAVGYFFARDLFQKLGVPIGLVHSSYSGTPVEAWMSPAALASAPEFTRVSERWAEDLAAYAARKTQFDRDLAAWTAAEAAAKTLVAPTKKSGSKTPVATPHATFLQANPRPRAPRGFPSDPWQPAGLFNGMINPLLPYALRGALWYQGESNADRPAEYHALFTAMITAWRAHFGQDDLPFFWVNLADFKRPADLTGRSWAFLREAQTRTLALAHTGQALAIDLGDPQEIHPTNKQEVGRRLALLAKNRVYGLTTADTGPTFLAATREGAALRVTFAHAGDGLVAHDRPVQSLEVAGADRVFRPATAQIIRDTLLVSAPEVRDPVAVRYAWFNAPEANLYNGSGLPAAPFRSDNW